MILIPIWVFVIETICTGIILLSAGLLVFGWLFGKH